jgi:hypothetical protein
MTLKVKEEVVERILYRGITSVEVDWSCSAERFFLNAEFAMIVDRCEESGTGVNGLEVFSSSGHLQRVAFSPVSEDRGANWCRRVLDAYREPGFLFSATFFLPGAMDVSGREEGSQSDARQQDLSLADLVENLERLMSEVDETSSAMYRKR